ncbi:hypothetical protein HI113_42900 [Corallococcus exiguus]|uniref:hypothetical protein n=1 Tax=Corallococcus exiguus TaxID=83462 RepID=UPI001472FD06|nr:hypothetical protein [Corallococcus exiguus]NNC00614.1 hypothetical protein [Corallococcus exiguus]
MTVEDKTAKPSRSDKALQLIVHAFNVAGSEVSITLTTGGTLLSGMLIPPKKYIAGMGAALREGFLKLHADTAAADAAAKDFMDALESVVDTTSSATENAGPGALPEYIHLMNIAVRREDGQLLTINNTYWRGRIASVDGFHLGK